MPIFNEKMQPQFRTIDGLRIRFATGGTDAGTPILFASPWPQSIVAFDTIWRAVASRAPLVAIDLPGFGQSEGRSDLMMPKAMGEFIARAVDSFQLNRPHLVAPNIGTSAALHATAAHPHLLSSIVVGGGAVDVDCTGDLLKHIIEAPDLSSFSGADGGDIVVPALKASLPALEADELEDFRVSYAGTRFVESLAYVRSFPKTLPPLRDELHGIQTPTLIIYGKHDTAVLPGNADLLSRTLRNTQTIALDCGHFVWEEDADAYSVALLAWIGGGYRDALSPTGLTDIAAPGLEPGTSSL